MSFCCVVGLEIARVVVDVGTDVVCGGEIYLRCRLCGGDGVFLIGDGISG